MVNDFIHRLILGTSFLSTTGAIQDFPTITINFKNLWIIITHPFKNVQDPHYLIIKNKEKVGDPFKKPLPKGRMTKKLE